MNHWIDLAGPVAYPLLACSVLVLALMLDCGWRIVRTRLTSLPIERLLNGSLCGQDAGADIRALALALDGVTHPMVTGVRLILEHRLSDRTLREELVNHWLGGHRQMLVSHLGGLTLMAVLTPMLGLLGTILGMIDAFRAVAASVGPIQPALIADGIWEAMVTTALGLGVAIPALIASHSLSSLAHRYLERSAHLLNALNLRLELPTSTRTVGTPSTSEQGAEVFL